MKFNPYLTPTRFIATLAGVVAFILALSFVAGQFRGCRKPVVPPVKPGYVDPGAPAPGPVNEAPTVPEEAEIAVPQLTRAQVLELAAKYGLVLTKKGTVPGHQPVGNSPGGSTPTGETGTGDRPAEPILEGHFPRLFAEEIYGPGPAGDYARVSAWQLEPGGRVDLRAIWEDYQGPPLVPKKESYFGNTAKWEKFIMLGYVGQVIRHDDGTTETKADPGVGLGLAFHSWRIGKANLDTRAIALVTPNGGAAIGGFGLSW